MCESKVVLMRDGKKKVIMETAALVKIDDGSVTCRDITGDEVIVKNVRIDEINFLKHELLLFSEE